MCLFWKIQYPKVGKIWKWNFNNVLKIVRKRIFFNLKSVKKNPSFLRRTKGLEGQKLTH